MQTLGAELDVAPAARPSASLRRRRRSRSRRPVRPRRGVPRARHRTAARRDVRRGDDRSVALGRSRIPRSRCTYELGGICLASLLRRGGRVLGDVERVRPAGVLEDRANDLAVGVDAALAERRIGVELGQPAGDLGGRDRGLASRYRTRRRERAERLSGPAATDQVRWGRALARPRVGVNCSG